MRIRPNRKFQKNMQYDIQCRPQVNLPCMIYMMGFVEAEGKKISQVFPLSTELTPKYIRIDTTSATNLLLTREYAKVHRSKDSFLRKGNLVAKQGILWKIFFRTEMTCFKGKKSGSYKFHHMGRKPRTCHQFFWKISSDSALKVKFVVRVKHGKRNTCRFI